MSLQQWSAGEEMSLLSLSDPCGRDSIEPLHIPAGKIQSNNPVQGNGGYECVVGCVVGSGGESGWCGSRGSKDQAGGLV